MSETVIRASNIGKKYSINHKQREKYVTIRDLLYERLRRLKQPSFKSQNRSGSQREIFWALKDVSFEVKQGEVVGIIGRNGAGKSTLLKTLSRIVEPTEGEFFLKGRVSSLLEVGTGFHPELTGRENIFLNGAILGMTRRQINKKLDEIIDFSEVSKFIDTPVKRYSSGMYVRLAFAVAAHLEPDILIVDEVLAVGDMAFQKKCLGKIGDVASSGRTVLFVSHDMNSIETLTSRCILLNSGKIELDDTTRKTVSKYFSSTELTHCTNKIRDWPQRFGSGLARIVSLNVSTKEGEKKTVFNPMEAIRITVGIEFYEKLKADIGIVIETDREYPLFTSHLSDSSPVEEVLGYKEFSVLLSPNHLKRGNYKISISTFSKDLIDFYDVTYHLPAFEVDGMSMLYEFPDSKRWGDLHFLLKWDTNYLS